MSNILFYFTGTGNSLSIAKGIQEKIPNTHLIPMKSYEIPPTISSETQRIGIIYPTYFLDAPEHVLNYIRQLEIPSGVYVFLYTNYGASKGNALYNPYRILEKNGVTVDATFEVALPDNSIIFPTKEDIIPAMLGEAKQQQQKHVLSIQKKEKTNLPVRKIGNHMISQLMKPYCESYLGFKSIQIDKGSCIECGLCEKVCSNQNISKINDHYQAGKECLMCFACIHYCTQRAVSFKRMKTTAPYQYTNPDVNVREIIECRM